MEPRPALRSNDSAHLNCNQQTCQGLQTHLSSQRWPSQCGVQVSLVPFSYLGSSYASQTGNCSWDSLDKQKSSGPSPSRPPDHHWEKQCPTLCCAAEADSSSLSAELCTPERLDMPESCIPESNGESKAEIRQQCVYFCVYSIYKISI